MITDRIIRYFTYIINLPLYYISFFIPKNKNIWVFGAWFGEKYADNSKALFEFVNNNDKEIFAVWLTESKTVFNELNQKGLNVYYTYSLFGYYYSAIARYVFVSSGMSDINRYAIARGCIIQLWHGTPLKRIDNVKKNQSILYLLRNLVFPYSNPKYNYVLSASDNNIKDYKIAFQTKDVIIKGYPRNDLLFRENFSNEKRVLYLPTFRDNTSFNVFEKLDVALLQSFCIRMNINFYYKLHFADKNTSEISEFNISKVTDEDLYQLLSKTDILITDYSSVYFDFLLLDRPVIFTPFDFKDYISKDREMYYDYDKVTPGPRCENWNEVMNEIEKLMNGEDNYRGERKKTNNYFNKYQDGNSSKRVYEFFKNMN